MKVSKTLIFLLIVCCWLIPSAALAEVKADVVTVSAMLGGILIENDQPVDDDGMVYSLGLGYNLSKEFGLEAVLAGANLEAKDSSDGDVDLFTYRLDAVYRFVPENKLVPYLAAGLGSYSLGSDDEFMVNWGGGLLYFFAENIALRADVRDLVAFDKGNLEHNLTCTAGFLVQLAGEGAPVPIKAPLDSDDDGVIDYFDKCPNTAKGVPVDSTGCPLDSDGDGVLDYLDQCPETPVGSPVDAEGCPLDSDGDGVINDLDQCPDTSAGAPVDTKGCPLDSDNDGVYDYLDQCPDTPAGSLVDAKGCPLKLTLHINFDFNSSTINSEFNSEIDKAAAFIKANGNVPYIVVAGHTDSKGKDTYNKKLSERRAEAVRQALIDNYSLDGDKMRTCSYGETQPIADNTTEEGRYLNRRVELGCCTILAE